MYRKTIPPKWQKDGAHSVTLESPQWTEPKDWWQFRRKHWQHGPFCTHSLDPAPPSLAFPRYPLSPPRFYYLLLKCGGKLDWILGSWFVCIYVLDTPEPPPLETFKDSELNKFGLGWSHARVCCTHRDIVVWGSRSARRARTHRTIGYAVRTYGRGSLATSTASRARRRA